MRAVSLPALRAMLAQESDDPFIPLLRIEHPSLAAPILLAYNTEPVTRVDGVYQPYAFQINLPAQREDEAPTLDVTIDNTDLEVNDALRSLDGMPKVTFSVVLASSPDIDEAGPFVLNLQNARADAQQITGTLGYEADIFAQSVPAQQYLPASSQGLFT